MWSPLVLTCTPRLLAYRDAMPFNPFFAQGNSEAEAGQPESKDPPASGKSTASGKSKREDASGKRTTKGPTSTASGKTTSGLKSKPVPTTSESLTNQADSVRLTPPYRGKHPPPPRPDPPPPSLAPRGRAATATATASAPASAPAPASASASASASAPASAPASGAATKSLLVGVLVVLFAGVIVACSRVSYSPGDRWLCGHVVMHTWSWGHLAV